MKEKNWNRENLIHSFPPTDGGHGNYDGLTKREYFAGLAMQGILATGTANLHEHIEYVSFAIKWADELLKQLSE